MFLFHDSSIFHSVDIGAFTDPTPLNGSVSRDCFFLLFFPHFTLKSSILCDGRQSSPDNCANMY